MVHNWKIALLDVVAADSLAVVHCLLTTRSLPYNSAYLTRYQPATQTGQCWAISQLHGCLKKHKKVGKWARMSVSCLKRTLVFCRECFSCIYFELTLFIPRIVNKHTFKKWLLQAEHRFVFSGNSNPSVNDASYKSIFGGPKLTKHQVKVCLMIDFDN